MRASFKIFSESGYVQRAFRGAVTYLKLRQFTARQLRDPRLPLDYDSISDFTQATLHLADAEVREFAEWLGRQPKFSQGRRALVVTKAHNFAIASLFEQCMVEYGVAVRAFHTRESAQRWLMVEREAALERTQPLNNGGALVSQHVTPGSPAIAQFQGALLASTLRDS